MRYQHASDIGADLQRLKRDTESERAKISAPVSPTISIAKRWKIAVPALFLILALSVVSYLHLRHGPKLTDKDTIVLADFTNATGDSVFDDTLRQGIAVQLANRLS